MDLTQKIKNALMTSALALSMYACTTNYQPNIEVYRGKDKNYLKMELPDGRVLQDSARKYMKIDISDSIRYNVDGKHKTVPKYLQDTTKTTSSDDDDWLMNNMLLWAIISAG